MLAPAITAENAVMGIRQILTIQQALLVLMPLRGRLGSVLASWQEMNIGFNHGQQNNTPVVGDSLFRGTFGNAPSPSIQKEHSYGRRKIPEE
jgi:hypothetical protein